jgi:photosystem II stability/assembly factor-like uncharacterized protein
MKSSCCILASALGVFAAFIFSPVVGAQGWQPLTAPVTVEFRDLDFTSALCGTVVGENSTILRTTDGGQTWTAQTAAVNEWFMTISYATDSVGLIGGTGGTILFTQNAGTTWTTIQTGLLLTYEGAHQFSPTAGIVAGVSSIFAPLVAYTTSSWQSITPVAFYLMDSSHVSNEGTLFDVQMLDANTAIAAAHVWNGEGAIVRTTNGGSTWSTVYWTAGSLMAVDFPTATIGYVVGISGQRIKTTDGGITWAPLTNPLRINWWDVDFINADTGWIVGENASIYRTNDGGLTWDAQYAGTGYLYGVDFVNSALGYATGENGMILKTTTGGNLQNLPPTNFSRLLPADSSVDPFSPPPYVRFIWSSSGDPEGGEITYVLNVRAPTLIFDERFVTSDTSQTVSVTLPPEDLDEVHTIQWTVVATDGIDTVFANNGSGVFFINYSAANEPSALAAREFGLVNYPNPFNSSTIISYSLPQTGSVVLRVFDVAGREVFTRTAGVLPAGTHHAAFDASGLSSGVYFARLETARGMANHKMILLR